MTAAIATPIHQIELMPGSAIRIADVTWESYLALLHQLGDDRSTRVAYENGALEIRMPGQPHESANRVLAAIALTLAEELGFEFNDLGSMTMNRPDLVKGVEPDSCFYIQNAQAGQGLGDVVGIDLPPDLVLEVDIANRSDSKLSIYTAMRVPEVWLYQAGVLTIKRLLEDGYTDGYTDSATSLAFPGITVEQLNQWLDLRRTGTDLTVVRAVRQFCRTFS
ncbi:MAG: Uma2 family endonuclease [Oculatellaceae cyanobacterium Prado106]|jgi:Uma2 family endonuclease|nr:Uma2 family endonuclease [Oculatellaceae cyanobacterium Prado106]